MHTPSEVTTSGPETSLAGLSRYIAARQKVTADVAEWASLMRDCAARVCATGSSLAPLYEARVNLLQKLGEVAVHGASDQGPAAIDAWKSVESAVASALVDLTALLKNIAEMERMLSICFGRVASGREALEQFQAAGMPEMSSLIDARNALLARAAELRASRGASMCHTVDLCDELKPYFGSTPSTGFAARSCATCDGPLHSRQRSFCSRSCQAAFREIYGTPLFPKEDAIEDGST